jgi:hypothetical protein
VTLDLLGQQGFLIGDGCEPATHRTPVENLESGKSKSIVTMTISLPVVTTGL